MMRKMVIAAIPEENFIETRQCVECYFSYEKRMGMRGFFVTWLPIERKEMGGVMFNVSNLVNTPVRLIDSNSKRFSQKRADAVLTELLDGIAEEGSFIRSLIRDDYDSVRKNCCDGWKLPGFETAVLQFSKTTEACR